MVPEDGSAACLFRFRSRQLRGHGPQPDADRAIASPGSSGTEASNGRAPSMIASYRTFPGPKHADGPAGCTASPRRTKLRNDYGQESRYDYKDYAGSRSMQGGLWPH